MINQSELLDLLRAEDFPETWLRKLPDQLDHALDPARNIKIKHWKRVLSNLPSVRPATVNLNRPAIQVGAGDEISEPRRSLLTGLLHDLHPWRKGPFELFGIYIDTEWRSDLKWDRVSPALDPLQGRRVLDVGCGNGYHCWRMHGNGARLVMGIDPFLNNVFQFYALKQYIPEEAVFVLPLAIEDLPAPMKVFDTVFSMGVLYHRRSSIDHLYELRNCLRSGGQLVLESLVIEGPKGYVLVPEKRYAKMRNVWFLPTCATLESWMRRCGLKDIRLIDVTRTTADEQRSTEWMTFESLPHFLDKQNPLQTVEGLPAPRRALFTAREP